MRISFIAVTALVSLLTSCETANDWLIVPGERVGPITAATTIEDLRKWFGAAQVVEEEIHVEEGMYEPGVILFPKDPERQLQILWQHEKRVVFICRVAMSCRWHTRERITIGTSLRDLERLNGRPFELAGFGWDFSGGVGDWKGGALQPIADRGMFVRLMPGGQSYDEAVSGDRLIPSGHPEMQRLNPKVYSLPSISPVRKRPPIPNSEHKQPPNAAFFLEKLGTPDALISSIGSTQPCARAGVLSV